MSNPVRVKFPCLASVANEHHRRSLTVS